MILDLCTPSPIESIVDFIYDPMRPTSLPGLTVMKASMQCSTRKNELKIELPTKPLTKSQKHYRFFISSIKGNPKRRSNIIHHHSSSRFQSVLLPTSASSLLFAPPAIFYPIQLIDSFTLALIRSKERKISDNQRPS